MISALAYPFWFAVSPMVLLSEKKREPFVHFHALQALIFGGALTLAFIFSFFLVGFIFRIFSAGPVLEHMAFSAIAFLILFGLYTILLLAGVLLILYFAYQTFQGKTFAIPFVTPFVMSKIFPEA